MLSLQHGAPLSRKFKWSGMVAQDRVRVWLDNRVVIDQWSSLASPSPTAVFKFPMQQRHYDVQLEWMRQGDTLTNASSSPELLECHAASAWSLLIRRSSPPSFSSAQKETETKT